MRTVTLLYKGLSIESVLDRFPTAQIIEHDDKGWTVKAEVYMVMVWVSGLSGQGNTIEVISDK